MNFKSTISALDSIYDGQQEEQRTTVRMLEIERGGDGKVGRHNSRRVYVNTLQGNDTVLETRNNDGQYVWRDEIYLEI
jgi:hypothetical protein